MKLALDILFDFHPLRNVPRLRGSLNVKGSDGRDTGSARLQRNRSERAVIDLLPEETKKILVMGQDDRLRRAPAELPDFDGGELAAEVIEACERVVQNDDCVLEAGVRVDAGKKQRERESGLVAGAEGVPEARLVQRLRGTPGGYGHVVDEDLIARRRLLAAIVGLPVVDAESCIQTPEIGVDGFAEFCGDSPPVIVEFLAQVGFFRRYRLFP